MSKTKISWATHSWNPFVGCSLASPACTNCYAMHQGARILRMQAGRNGYSPYEGAVEQRNGRPVWTGRIQQAGEKTRFEPLRRAAPRTIFVGSMSDFFHPSAANDWRIEALAVAALTPQHTYLILTKRAADMRAFMSDPATAKAVWNKAREIGTARHKTLLHLDRWPLPNVALGVSAEDQKRADERIPDLLATPAAMRFVSCEPLLGPIDLCRVRVAPNHHTIIDALDGYALTGTFYGPTLRRARIDFVIAGGENDLGDRLTHPDWLRALRDQCAATGTKFHFKQHGAWAAASQLAPGQESAFFETEMRILDQHGGPVTRVYMARDGRIFRAATAEAAEAKAILMLRVGTAYSGRTLDGRTHDDVLGETPAALPSPLVGEGGRRPDEGAHA